MRITILVLISILIIGIVESVYAEDNYDGKFSNVNTSNRTVRVTKILDGDTILIGPYDDRLGLVGIKAPDLGQNGSFDSRNYLANRTMYKLIQIDVDNKRPKDIDDRILAVVYIDGVNINKEMLCKGYARVGVEGPSEFNPEEWKSSCYNSSSDVLVPMVKKNKDVDTITVEGDINIVDIIDDDGDTNIKSTENNSPKKSSFDIELIIAIVAILAVAIFYLLYKEKK